MEESDIACTLEPKMTKISLKSSFPTIISKKLKHYAANLETTIISNKFNDLTPDFIP